MTEAVLFVHGGVGVLRVPGMPVVPGVLGTGVAA